MYFLDLRVLKIKKNELQNIARLENIMIDYPNI